MLDNVSNFLNFELSSVLIARKAAKFQALFHVHSSPIIMQYQSVVVCVFFLLFLLVKPFFFVINFLLVHYVSIRINCYYQLLVNKYYHKH